MCDLSLTSVSVRLKRKFKRLDKVPDKRVLLVGVVSHAWIVGVIVSGA